MIVNVYSIPLLKKMIWVILLKKDGFFKNIFYFELFQMNRWFTLREDITDEIINSLELNKNKGESLWFSMTLWLWSSGEMADGGFGQHVSLYKVVVSWGTMCFQEWLAFYSEKHIRNQLSQLESFEHWIQWDRFFRGN